MLRTLDAHFLEIEPRPELSGLRRGLLEFGYFVAKEARACLFVAWTTVHWSKWSSWSLLVIMTFTIVANLKHIKARVHVPAP
jgi:uncharacterized membrane protein YoaT (DUF817 family)